MYYAFLEKEQAEDFNKIASLLSIMVSIMRSQGSNCPQLFLKMRVETCHDQYNCWHQSLHGSQSVPVTTADRKHIVS
jgi:hypothetical protein